MTALTMSRNTVDCPDPTLITSRPRRGRRRASQHRIDDVVGVDVVSQLPAVAEDL
jgi:hypothetical protein